MVQLDIEGVPHPVMSMCEAFVYAMCLQQQYDFLVISAIFIVDGMTITFMCVDTNVLLSVIYPFSALNPF